MRAAAETLAALRAAVGRIEPGNAAARPGGRVALGPAEIDGTLGGGLKRGAFHAVTASDPSGAGAATGFAAALARRAMAGTQGRALWIRQDMEGIENGEPWGPGLMEIGLDPTHLVIVRTRDLPGALKAAETALGCGALATVVIEPFGATPRFDGIAGRRLSLAAGRSGALGLLLRIAPPARAPLPAGLLAAQTRWRIAPLSSTWAAAGEDNREAWGRPVARVELVRNRLGATGAWPLAWGFDDGAFRIAERRFGLAPAGVPAETAAPDPRARSAGPTDRPSAAEREEARPARRAG